MRSDIETTSVTIIIPVHNREAELRKCLESLRRTITARTHVIIVDDASTDDTIAALQLRESENLDLSVIRVTSQQGPAHARNLGVLQAKTELLVFLDSDAVCEDDWLTPLARCAQNPRTAIVQATILEASGDNLQTAGIKLGRPVPLPVHQVQDLHTSTQARPSCSRIFAATTTGMLVKRKVFLEVGMFDVDYFIQHEDVDLSWRTRLHGYEVMVANDSFVRHVGGVKIDPARKSGVRYHHLRNWCMTVLKNASSRELPLFLGMFLASQIGLGIGFLMTRKTLQSKDVFLNLARAILWNAENLRTTLRKRRKTARACAAGILSVEQDLRAPVLMRDLKRGLLGA